MEEAQVNNMIKCGWIVSKMPTEDDLMKVKIVPRVKSEKGWIIKGFTLDEIRDKAFAHVSDLGYDINNLKI